MTVRTPDSGFESIEHRFERLERIIPFLLLAVPLIPYVLSQSPTAGAVGITVGVAVAAGAWIMWMVILHPGGTERRWVMGVYLAGLIAFIAVLTIRSPWFAFFTWFGFLHAMRYLTGAWRWVACAAVAIFFGMAQAGGFHRPAVSTVAIWILLACVDVVLVGAFTALGVKSEQQNQARKGMIAELAEANQRLEEIMAENTGLQAQLLIQAREAGAGDERQRMAREIHDTLAQGLTGIITQLEAAQQTSNDTERERRIGNAKRLARDSLAEARRSVQALRPQALENSRLPEALADEVARWSATSGVAGEVETTGEVRALHPEVEVTLLRVAQEALANVAKHADASRAGVTLSYMEDVVSLDVRDDGAGFIPPTSPPPSNGSKVNGSQVNGSQVNGSQVNGSQVNGSQVNGSQVNGSQVNGSPSDGGFGLIAMRQRVSRLAGQLEIESEPGAGTAVSASLPAIPLGESH